MRYPRLKRIADVVELTWMAIVFGVMCIIPIAMFGAMGCLGLARHADVGPLPVRHIAHPCRRVRHSRLPQRMAEWTAAPAPMSLVVNARVNLLGLRDPKGVKTWHFRASRDRLNPCDYNYLGLLPLL